MLPRWACQILRDPTKEEFQVLEGTYIVVLTPSPPNSSIIMVLGFKLFIYGVVMNSFIMFLYLYMCRVSHPTIITSNTVEVIVPRTLVPIIYGEDGACLKQIRQVYSTITYSIYSLYGE